MSDGLLSRPRIAQICYEEQYNSLNGLPIGFKFAPSTWNISDCFKCFEWISVPWLVILCIIGLHYIQPVPEKNGTDLWHLSIFYLFSYWGYMCYLFMTVIYRQLTICTQNYLCKDADYNGIIDKAKIG